MKIGVFSDIHSNLEALEAVLDDASHQGVTHCLCVGDQVGYNADPHACMERLRALPRLLCCVQGNHDYYAANQEELLQFNPIAKQAACWTREHLSLEDRQELARLPLVAHVPLPGPLGGLQVVHASLVQPEEWPYLMDTMSVLNCFRMLQADLCFLGHSHVPLAIVLRENGLEVRDCPEFSLKAGDEFFLATLAPAGCWLSSAFLGLQLQLFNTCLCHHIAFSLHASVCALIKTSHIG